jgi:hypothetical protein
MRQVTVGATLLLALALVATPTASAQMGGFGGLPFGGGRGGFGFGMPGGPGGFGMPGGPGGFGMPGSQFQGAGPGFLSNVTQVCTDSQGNRVLVRNGSSTSGYTNCTTQ